MRSSFLSMVAPILAHKGVPPQPHDLWTSWNWDIPLLVGLYGTLFVYFVGLRILWSRRGTGRVVKRWQVVAFVAGILALFIALISPLDALGSALFSAHMTQHMLLLIVAPPLLVVSLPLLPTLWGLPSGIRGLVSRLHHHQTVHGIWTATMHPLIIWVMHVGVLWLWHIPALYEAALAYEFIHILEHLTFFGVSLLYWWSLIRPIHARSEYGISVLSLFAMMLQGGLLGALLTFSRIPWYTAYENTVGSWGLTLIEDQQLAGVIMWLPAGIVYLSAALLLLGNWLMSMDRAQDGAYPKQQTILSEEIG